MGRFDGKAVVVTGAGSGMGRAAARRFASDGAQVVVADIVDPAGKETVDLITAAGGQAIFQHVDAASWESVQALCATAVSTYGKLDVWVNNAGILEWEKAADLPIETWDKVINVNLRGYFYGCKAALPELIKTKGNIVMTASIAGLGSRAGGTAYTTSKFGTMGLIRQVAADYGAEGVRVNGVAPGAIETGMIEPMLADEAGRQAIDALLQAVPMGRMGKSEEVGDVIAFLASDEARYVTGAVLTVDGGWRA